jgi:hypothetical protein
MFKKIYTIYILSNFLETQEKPLEIDITDQLDKIEETEKVVKTQEKPKGNILSENIIDNSPNQEKKSIYQMFLGEIVENQTENYDDEKFYIVYLHEYILAMGNNLTQEKITNLNNLLLRLKNINIFLQILYEISVCNILIQNTSLVFSNKAQLEFNKTEIIYHDANDKQYIIFLDQDKYSLLIVFLSFLHEQIPLQKDNNKYLLLLKFFIEKINIKRYINICSNHNTEIDLSLPVIIAQHLPSSKKNNNIKNNIKNSSLKIINTQKQNGKLTLKQESVKQNGKLTLKQESVKQNGKLTLKQEPVKISLKINPVKSSVNKKKTVKNQAKK